MSNPLRAVPLPEPNRQWLRVIYPKAGQSVSAYSLSPFIVGRHMHWVDGRTQLCLIETGECAWHTHHYPTRWVGYLYGHDPQHKGPCLIQCSAECVRASLQLRDPSVDLRGALITLTRPAGRHNARVHANVQLHALKRDFGNDIPDVLSHLARFYGVTFSPEGRHELDKGAEE